MAIDGWRRDGGMARKVMDGAADKEVVGGSEQRMSAWIWMDGICTGGWDDGSSGALNV